MNPFTGLTRDLTEIAAALIGVAVIGLLVTNANGTATVAQGVGNAFSGVLSVATFQNGGFGLRSNVGNVFNSALPN